MTPASLPVERHRRILDRLREEGRVLAVDLARLFGTSEDTIRRDLRELAAAGQLKRVYGGALRLAPSTPPLRERETADTDRKNRLARRALSLVQTGQIVFIDASTSNLALARALTPDLALTVVTNSPQIAAALLGRPRIDVLMTGGRLDHRTGGLSGVRALQTVQGIRADLCFLGACSLHADHGLTSFDPEESALKRAIAEMSGETCALVSSEKVGTVAPYTVAPTSAITHVVTDSSPQDPAIVALRDRQVRIHIAGEAHVAADAQVAGEAHVTRESQISGEAHLAGETRMAGGKS
jgi:DeoR/GlpR family transcriptional regulator of sugar metabolism